jgi:hypothetical protein
MMKLSVSEDQQGDMRQAHLDGAPGILVSGLVWCSAALVCMFVGVPQGVWTLLIGGAMIFPVAVLLTKALGRTGKAAKGNALDGLAIASTLWLILGCAMAYGLFLSMPILFFPAMLATIGCRYLVFATLFGRPVFLTMGASLIAAGLLTLFAAAPPAAGAAIGGAIEVLFALFVFATPSRALPVTLPAA